MTEQLLKDLWAAWSLGDGPRGNNLDPEYRAGWCGGLAIAIGLVEATEGAIRDGGTLEVATGERVKDDGDVIAVETCGERAVITQDDAGLLTLWVTTDQLPGDWRGFDELPLTPQQARAVYLALRAWSER